MEITLLEKKFEMNSGSGLLRFHQWRVLRLSHYKVVSFVIHSLQINADVHETNSVFCVPGSPGGPE
jgi:hypothetical protein